ncbi:DUF4384 domain-containing protein [Nitrospira sp. Kam-Ns4a]
MRVRGKRVCVWLVAGFIFMGSLAVAAGSPPQETWVEAEGTVAWGQHATLDDVQRDSLDAARRAAIEQAVGTFVRSSSVVRNFQLADDIVHSISRGVIMEDKILSRGPVALQDGEGMLYRTRIRAKVREIAAEHRGTFGVTVTLNHDVFHDGDEAMIRIRATEDAYLYLFNVTQDEHIWVLAPNRYEPETRLRAGIEYVFPSEALTKQRVKLRTWLLPGAKRTVEKIKVIATRQPISLLKGQVSEAVFKEYEPSQTALLLDLRRALALLDPADWAEATVEYEVRK